jgi:hypothetical protein
MFLNYIVPVCAGKCVSSGWEIAVGRMKRGGKTVVPNPVTAG